MPATNLQSWKLSRSHLAVLGIVLAATSLLSVGAFNDDMIWRAALPGRTVLITAQVIVLLANCFAGVLACRSVKNTNAAGGFPLFGTCLVAYLVIAVAAVAIDHQYSLLNRHYINKRRPVAYESVNPDAVKQWVNRLNGSNPNVGPDFAELLRSDDFQRALHSDHFYKQVHDEAFQVSNRAVMHSYRINSAKPGAEPLFRTIRFPLEIALALRFEPCGHE